MNNPASVAYGWGVLIIAGAGSYYFAKKSIDERRRLQERDGKRPSEKKSWQQRVAESESAVTSPEARSLSTPADKAKIQNELLGGPAALAPPSSGLQPGDAVRSVASGRGVGVGEGDESRKMV